MDGRSRRSIPDWLLAAHAAAAGGAPPPPFMAAALAGTLVGSVPALRGERARMLGCMSGLIERVEADGAMVDPVVTDHVRDLVRRAWFRGMTGPVS